MENQHKNLESQQKLLNDKLDKLNEDFFLSFANICQYF